MADSKLSRRYAKSLLDLGRERGIEMNLFNDMKLVLDTIRQNRELGNMFRSPIVNTDKKENIIRETFKGKVEDVSLEFMLIIARKKREYFLEDIAASFVRIYKIHKNIQPATVITAVPLSDKLRGRMLELVRQSSNSTVELKEVVDPSIIGGYILRWDDKQVDASVTTKLHYLRKEFSKNLYIKDY